MACIAKKKFGGKEKEGDAKATGGQSSSSVAVLPLRACAFASGIAKFSIRGAPDGALSPLPGAPVSESATGSVPNGPRLFYAG